MVQLLSLLGSIITLTAQPTCSIQNEQKMEQWYKIYDCALGLFSRHMNLTRNSSDFVTSGVTSGYWGRYGTKKIILFVRHCDIRSVIILLTTTHIYCTLNYTYYFIWSFFAWLLQVRWDKRGGESSGQCEGWLHCKNSSSSFILPYIGLSMTQRQWPLIFLSFEDNRKQ